MLNIHKLKILLRKAFIPVTIMFIPHTSSKPLNLKIPSIGILISILLWISGTFYIISIAVDAFEYQSMKNKLNYYSTQFSEMKNTIRYLKKAEKEFRRLFSLESKEKILENFDNPNSGSIDMENLKQEITKSMEKVKEIKSYLKLQKDIYLATPIGMPVNGYITSPYGIREHPKTKAEEFHSGIDITSEPGTPIRATADGIVSFSGWNGGSGNLVVLEHGFGYCTLYAHNKLNTVKVGEKVKRGDIIGYIGSTGNATGPHVHYEIWKDGNSINPKRYIEGRS
ncbi:MAG: M23 family metallopeptidase [Thermodesulfovibrionales bacterium]